MARKKRTPSPTQKAYRRERQRIQKQMRRMEARGYDVPDLLPDIPKRITPASVRRLENITTEKMYNRSRYIDQSSGEILTGTEGRNLERQERARRRRERKPAPLPGGGTPLPSTPETDYTDYYTLVFTNFQNQMSQIFGNNPKLLNYLIRWFYNSLQTYGKEDFAKALEKTYENGEWPGWEAISDETLLAGSLRQIIQNVGGSQGAVNEIMEELEYMEDWTDA